MRLRRDFIKIPTAAALAGALGLAPFPSRAQQVTSLNVLYDPTRVLYAELNQAFARYWKPEPANRNFYRPAVSQKAQARYAGRFPKLNLFTIDQAFSGWSRSDREHFAEGGSFDQIYSRK